MKFVEIVKQIEQNPFSAFFYTPLIYPEAKSVILTSPFEIINVYNKNDLQKVFKLSDKLILRGMSGYILINYEAGYLFERKLEKLIGTTDQKLIQFFFFKNKNISIINSSDIAMDDEVDENFSINQFGLNISGEHFKKNVSKIKKFIKTGDTYQVNYTVKGKFSYSGSFATFFKNLLFNQSARYSAFINNDENFIISLSPELFFRVNKKKIISQPMKGTISRGAELTSDLANALSLTSNEKNKAENVMIVDLIRNDLGKICRYGSITVPELFKVEKYESLFQMISTIEGKLSKKINLSDVIKNIFPCGSVTGAPKIRTMEIIKELEKEDRGIYTGSIGLITKKELIFNVAIRTLTINKVSGKGEIGMGAGIVWDSDPEKEFEESILKSKFLTDAADRFELLETMLLENGQIQFLEEHLTRLKSGAEFFLFNFNEQKIKNVLQEEIQKQQKDKRYKLRLKLSKWDVVSIKISEIINILSSINVIVSGTKIESSNKFQHFKTTNRYLYDSEFNYFNSKGFFEVIFFNERNELAEGSRTNIFLRKQNSWLTPSLECGALPGIYREYLLKKNNNIVECPLSLQDLMSADEVMLTNSIIGEVKVDQIILNENQD